MGEVEDREELVQRHFEKVRDASLRVLKAKGAAEVKGSLDSLLRIYVRIAMADLASARDEAEYQRQVMVREEKGVRYNLDKMVGMLDEGNAALLEVGSVQPFLSLAVMFAENAVACTNIKLTRGPYAALAHVAMMLAGNAAFVDADAADELANLAWCAKRLPEDADPFGATPEGQVFNSKQT